MDHTQCTYKSFQLPVSEEWRNYFSKVRDDLKSLPCVIDAYITNSALLFVTTTSKDAMTSVSFKVQKEIEAFINKKQQFVRPSKPREKEKSTSRHISTNDELRINASRVLERILQRKQQYRVQSSGLRTTTWMRQLKIIKKRKTVRKKWYEHDHKLKRTKVLLKYIRQQSRYYRRHDPMLFYQQRKRSHFEYYQKKIMGRKKDRSKERHALMHKIRFQSKRNERKVLSAYKRTTTCGSHMKYSNISIFKNENKAKWKTELLLRSYVYFPKARVPSRSSLTYGKNKQLLRYCNQHVFIYVVPVNHRGRPSNKYLINTFSTINNIESKFFNNQQSLPTPTRTNKVKKKKSCTREQVTQVTTLVKPPHHNNIASQSVRPGKQKNGKKSKRLLKQNC
jgi:hypothetical protein